MSKKQGKQQTLPSLEKTRATYDKQLPELEASLHSLYQDVRRLLERNGFTPTIKYRVKRLDAYYDKLRRTRSNLENNGRR